MSATNCPPIGTPTEAYFGQHLPYFMAGSHDRDIAEYWIDELNQQREKDAQLIQRLLKTLDQCKKPDLFDNLHIHSAFEAAAQQGHKLAQ